VVGNIIEVEDQHLGKRIGNQVLSLDNFWNRKSKQPSYASGKVPPGALSQYEVVTVTESDMQKYESFIWKRIQSITF
jgi:hypothetical protein